MLKILTWFRRKEGMSVEEFRAYWREEHPRVVLALPGLRKYVQNHVLDSQYRRNEPFVDGVAETWWDDIAALRAHRNTPELDAVSADEARFIDPAHRSSAVAEEVVIINGAIPVDGVKMIAWLRRRADVPLPEAQQYWRTQHAAIASTVPGMRRYVQNHVHPGRVEGEFMGLPVTWFADLDQMRANASAPELAATRADEANFLRPDLDFVLAREHHII